MLLMELSPTFSSFLMFYKQNIVRFYLLNGKRKSVCDQLCLPKYSLPLLPSD